MMTTEERERLAYAEGYTETAEVLARLDDAHRALGSEAAMQAELDDALSLVDGLRDERDAERDAYRAAMNEADQWHNAAKNYRAALMALESEVSPRLREFIREVLA
jgi:hypothetical protein